MCWLMFPVGIWPNWYEPIDNMALDGTLCVVFIFCGCHNKLPCTGWLKTIEVYSLTILESKINNTGPKSRCWQGCIFFRGFRVESVPCLFQPLSLPAFLGSWLHHSNLCFCLHLTVSSVYILNFPLLLSLTGTLVMAFGVHPDNPW